ncbi:TadE/TadG family type IV pilus assembly protein [Chelativorans alearense]|uniref:TadE/TadG family type IV pilus assembly protein n=1 Tax=Chelativorans alearense TaxID=2681495 RepID=UPI0013D11054|nr:TadE/TadG family type IV pilus assembly protein [Chelativorans alearense]
MWRAWKRLIENFERDERGQILVEMTLITPLMISLSAGVFEFGNLIHHKLLIEAGLRDAARYYARCNTQLFADAGLSIDCTTNAQNTALYGSTSVGTLRVEDWSGPVTISTYTTTNTVDPITGLQDYRSSGASVVTVRVTTSYDYAGMSLLSYLGMSPITLAAAHEERLVGW